MGQAILKVIREHRGVIGMLGTYNIIVNDLTIGQIKNGETKTFDIPAGQVVIQLAGVEGGPAGVKTDPLTFTNIADAEEILLGCRSVGMKNKSGIEVWQEGEEKS